MLDTIGLFILLTGFIIGLGAVTVIDIHGFLGRKSSYWTQATIRTHKVTKPLIWLGIVLAILGGIIVFRGESFEGSPALLSSIAVVLILNGCFLSFKVSPFLLKREKEGKETELLPQSLQKKIVISMLLSDLGWWSALILVVLHLTDK
jgi:hypothetical protein